MLMTMDARHVLALMGFLSLASEYMSRLDLSIAIVAMVSGGNINNEGSSSTSFSTTSGTCRIDSANSTFEIDATSKVVMKGKGEFDWGPKARGDLLGVYYYGNALTQILAGWIAIKFGFKKVVIVCE